MNTYLVSWDICEEVEANSRDEAIEKALSQYGGRGWYERNFVTDEMEHNARVAEVRESTE
jgi:ribosomal protein L20A (L18A)